MTRQNEKEPWEIEEERGGDDRAKHDAWDGKFFDKREARELGVKFTPRRRGPVEIKFPMPAKKALMRLTDQDTLEKAKRAYRHYAIARNMKVLRFGRPLTARHAEQEIMHILDGHWTFEFFRFHAELYAKYPRKNFDADPHEKRLSEILLSLSAKISK